jgi:D-methionine transport system substrate-binding protein
VPHVLFALLFEISFVTQVFLREACFGFPLFYFERRIPMKKIVSLILVALLALSLVACGGNTGITIAVPNDTTNEARALLLLDTLGYIKLDPDAGITATIRDITENPHNITFKEVEAAQLPNVLQDVDYAVINSNYAISANLNPVKDSLAIEGSSSFYSNILAVKKGNEKTDKVLALVAALESKQVADFIAEKYDGAVVSTVEKLTDGYNADLDYAALAGTKITVAASPTPHAEILEVAKTILAAKNVTLEIIEYTDYVQPNNVVDAGEIDANYFQHLPYLDDFNAQNGTEIVSVSAIHVEPLGLYGGKQTTLDALK